MIKITFTILFLNHYYQFLLFILSFALVETSELKPGRTWETILSGGLGGSKILMLGNGFYE